MRVPLRDERFDLDAILDAITERTKIVFVAAPNNPTGTTTTREELDAYFAARAAPCPHGDRPGVLRVRRRRHDYPDAVEEYLKAGHRVLVLRTFSKIYGLAGLRVGYGVGPEELVTAIGKVRRAFDVTSAGQEAALASLEDTAEVARRRAANREAIALLESALREHGLEPAGPAVANFLFVRVGDAEALNDALLRQGVIVRPLGPFGAPDALRITAGTPDEIAFLSEALTAVAPRLCGSSGQPRRVSPYRVSTAAAKRTPSGSCATGNPR